MKYLKLILEQKKIWIVLLLLILIVVLNLFSNKIINLTIQNHYDKIAETVIEKLQKDYCPSPYGPGIDPDKIDLDKFLKDK